MEKAELAGLDLVEIAPTAVPPVAKIIDYGKFRYHQAKKEKEGKKTQVQIKVKEVKIKPNIDTHDYQTKVKHAREFLIKGNKVRLNIVFRGREMLHMDLGMKVVKQFCDDLADVSVIESTAKLMGRTMTTILAPGGKRPKPKTGGPDRAQDEDA
jgi:translation initiation factor IF-3